jgi:hypothetical protein
MVRPFRLGFLLGGHRLVPRATPASNRTWSDVETGEIRAADVARGGMPVGSAAGEGSADIGIAGGLSAACTAKAATTIATARNTSVLAGSLTAASPANA